MTAVYHFRPACRASRIFPGTIRQTQGLQCVIRCRTAVHVQLELYLTRSGPYREPQLGLL
jgi:hypothetical protein